MFIYACLIVKKKKTLLDNNQLMVFYNIFDILLIRQKIYCIASVL